MYLHDAQLANIVTSYCTCLGGILPLLFCLLTRPHPRRWMLVYACVLITGIPTVWLHSMEGNRVASFFDVGTNILLALAVIIAVSGDFMRPERRRRLLAVAVAADLLAWVWLVYEVFAPEKRPLVTFGEFGQFYAGELALIANGWVAVILLVANIRHIPAHARPALWMMVATFFTGMLMATASNSEIALRIVPWHAVWHVTGMAGFLLMWLMNHTRFIESPAA
ncbi:MAG TPA: hypothetical protein P5141_07815, partial [Candidatus Hydrogenedentes bacterium]|nr:hypothetical protein [Candidatus Hydrogenedentota bacterium]